MTDADVITCMLHAIDALDWATIRASLADQVRTDYTSLFGGSPETMSVDDLITRWRALLPGFDATHHLTGPILVSDNRLDTHVVAHHWLADDTWTVHGHYTARLANGKIAELTLHTFHQDGNQNLPTIAGERAKSALRSG